MSIQDSADTKTNSIVKENIGKKITLTGKAWNEKSGPMIQLDSDPVFLTQLTFWPEEIVGKVISVTGTLKKRKIAPDPQVNKKGVMSQGMMGEAWIIEDAEWKVVEK
jgi:hypothetical protein